MFDICIHCGMCTYVYREGVVCTLIEQNRAQKQQHREVQDRGTGVRGEGAGGIGGGILQGVTCTYVLLVEQRTYPKAATQRGWGTAGHTGGQLEELESLKGTLPQLVAIAAAANCYMLSLYSKCVMAVTEWGQVTSHMSKCEQLLHHSCNAERV